MCLRTSCLVNAALTYFACFFSHLDFFNWWYIAHYEPPVKEIQNQKKNSAIFRHFIVDATLAVHSFLYHILYLSITNRSCLDLAIM